MDPALHVQGILQALYLGSVTLCGLLVCFRQWKRKHAPRLASWDIKPLDFLCLAWVISMLFIFAPSFLSEAIYGDIENPKDIPMPVLALLHTLPLIITYLVLLRFTPLLNGILPEKGTRLKDATNGIKQFFKYWPLMLATLFGSTYMFYALEKLGLPFSFEPQTYVTTLLESRNSADWYIMLIAAVFLAPITEEITFRAIIYRFFYSRISPIGATMISAFLFSAAHSSPYQFIPLFILGILLARAYEESGTIFTPILFHAAFNLNTIVILMLTQNP